MLEAGIKREYRDTILGHSLKGMDRHYIVPSMENLKEAMGQYTEWLDSKIEEARQNVDHSVDQATVR
jgi:hypothetical protein